MSTALAQNGPVSRQDAPGSTNARTRALPDAETPQRSLGELKANSQNKGNVAELRWCFGEYCRGPQPPENFRHPNGRQCKTCYKAQELIRSRKRKRNARKNPIVAERVRAQARAYWHRRATPEHLAELRMKKKLRYGADPEYRERMRQHRMKWWEKTKKPTFQCEGWSKNTGKRCTRKSHNPAGCQWHRQSREKAA